MANGYLRIKKADIYENNGVTYWKNGANIIGNVVKCVDSDEAEHYYIESLKTRKAILLDDDVKIGGGDFGFESTNGNFILVTTDEVNFSDIGGGDGVSITFTFGNKYYTVTLPEDNGDLKIYDPDGEGGETGADPLPDVTDASAGDVLALDENKLPIWAVPSSTPLYIHNLKFSSTSSSNTYLIEFQIVNDVSSAYSSASAVAADVYNKAGHNVECSATGYRFTSSTKRIYCAALIGSNGIAFAGVDLQIVNNAISFSEASDGTISSACTDSVLPI